MEAPVVTLEIRLGPLNSHARSKLTQLGSRFRRCASSGMGLRAAAQQSSYTVSKAGVHIFTECLANEFWPRKIDVNNLIPGPVATDIFNRERRPERYTPEEVLEKFKDELPPGFPPQERIKHPDEVADLAVSMATQPAGGATGQTFSLARRPF